MAWDFGAKFEEIAKPVNTEPFVSRPGQTVFTKDELVSPNYKNGETGWKVDAEGSAEFNNGIFRGALSASTIDIGGSDASSFHVDIDGNMWLGAASFDISTNPFAVSNAGVMRATSGVVGPWTLSSTAISTGAFDTLNTLYFGTSGLSLSNTFKVTAAGVLTATGATISGALTATSGAIGGFTIGTDYIRDAADSFGLASTVTGGDDVRFWAGDSFANRATADFRVTESGALTATSATITGAITAASGSVIATTYLSGAVALANTNIAAQGWTQTCVFTSTDYNTIAWSTATFTTAEGTSYSITGSNTGNMTLTTYIYLDINVSTTAYQTTTTATTAIGSGKVLIAVAFPNTDTTSDATVQVFGGIGGQIVSVDNISANSASTNEFVSNTAQIANLVVTNAKINDLSVAKLTAGTITSKAITLAVSGGTGDTKIQAGKTDFGDTTAGFILGIDDSDSDLAKFEIGNATDFMKFDGVGMEFAGTFNIGGTNITVDTIAEVYTALATVEAAGGGTVFLDNGTYTLTADINVPAGVVLQGVSRDGVILDCDTTYKVNIVGSNAYTTGTVAINDTQTTVVGTGTTFTSGMVGRYIMLSGIWYEITAFTDTTHITISPAYAGDNLSGYATVIADVNFAATLKRVTIINGTTGLKVQYAQEYFLDDIIVDGCTTGVDIDDTVFGRHLMSAVNCGVNFNANNMWGWKIDFSEFSNSTSGAGVVMTNSGSGTYFDSAGYDNTGNGISLTSCSNIAFVSVAIGANGGKGIELVSGCNDIQLIAFTSDGNASDGVKFTATSDRNTIVASSIINNGGYGINIAASTCDNNQIIAPAFDNNTSGNINDLGTNTFVSPQEFVDYTATQITSIVGSEPATWTDLDLSSIIGATSKVVMLKLTSTSGRLFAFRTNGDTGEYFDDTNANSQNIIKTDDNTSGTTIVKTDSSGVIEWKGSAITTGVSFGNTTIDTDQVSGTTSHNNDGNFVFVAINSTTNDVTAVTYAGVAMTQLGTSYFTSWSSRYHTTWYIANPATGANNVVTTGGTAWQFVIFSASGVDPDNPVSGLTTGTDQTSSNPTVSVTTTVDDAYAICVGQINDATVSGGTDTTLLVNGTGGGFYIFRSTNDTDGAGAFTLNVTSTGDWRLRGFGLNPARTTLTVLAAW